MGKTQKLFSLDYELVERLKEEDNASAIVNGLIKDWVNGVRTPEELKEEYLRAKAQFEDLQAKLIQVELAEKKAQDDITAVKTEMQQINEWLSENYNKEEYLEGVRTGKWRGVTEYARHKLQLK